MNWQRIKLGNLCNTVTKGTTPTSIGLDFASSGIPFLRIQNLNSDTVILDDVLYINEETHQSLKRSIIYPNDFLITIAGTIGKTAIVPEDFPECNCNQALAILRFDEQKLLPKHLLYWLNTPDALKQISGKSVTATISNLSLGQIKDLEIPLPPLAEQKRIAAILDKADAIRRKRQQAIQLADDFLRSVFLDMFGDPVTNPKSSEVLPMTKCFDITTGKLNSNAAVENGKYPFFTCAKEIFAIDDYAFDQEALLLAGNNAQAEYDVKHYNGKFNAYQRTYVLTLKNNDWSYPFFKFALEYQLQNLKRVSKGSNTKYITMEIMERTLLPAPKEGLQNEFVKFYDKHNNLINKQYALLKQADLQFSSLSQKAFSGQL